MKTCKECKLYRIQCTFNTSFIPDHIPQVQREQYIEAYYEESQHHKTCEEYEGWEAFVEEHKVSVICKDIQDGR